MLTKMKLTDSAIAVIERRVCSSTSLNASFHAKSTKPFHSSFHHGTFKAILYMAKLN